MFRLWAKIIKDNHLLKDLTVENDTEDTRTHKVFQALDEICFAFQRHAKTRFSQDQFIETIPFDYLEIHVIEED